MFRLHSLKVFKTLETLSKHNILYMKSFYLRMPPHPHPSYTCCNPKIYCSVLRNRKNRRIRMELSIGQAENNLPLTYFAAGGVSLNLVGNLLSDHSTLDVHWFIMQLQSTKTRDLRVPLLLPPVFYQVSDVLVAIMHFPSIQFSLPWYKRELILFTLHLA